MNVVKVPCVCLYYTVVYLLKNVSLFSIIIKHLVVFMDAYHTPVYFAFEYSVLYWML